MTIAPSRGHPARSGRGPRFVLRPATRSDLPALHALAGRAVRELLGGHYSAAQLRTAASIRIYQVEPALLEAGTYYVIEFEALCTPPSEGLRRRLGYRVVERVEFPLAAGIALGATRMRKELRAGSEPG